MPDGAVPRALAYVGLLFLLCLASTPAWWAGANVARTEYRRFFSAFACAMRVFFYSICLLCLLVAARSLHLTPEDPRSTLLSWIHLGGTAGISVPSAWRSFRVKGPRLALVVAVSWAICAGAAAVTGVLSPWLRQVLTDLPRYLTSG
ncbi:MAG: hypothetical protein ACYTEZ_07825 [Planctomycetota bacterium]|jgi:hypothetical protein